MQLGVGERGVLLGVGRQHLRLVAGHVGVGELTAQRGRHVEVADLVARRVADDPDDAVLRLAVLVRSQHHGHPPTLEGKRPAGRCPRTSASSTAPQSSPRRTYLARARAVAGSSAISCPRRARRRPPAGPARRPAPRGRTRTSRRTGSAAGPGAGPSPGRSRAPASGGPAGGGCCQAARPRRPRPPTGSMLVEPSESRTPVPAAAACMTSLAWSATGCSSDWYAAAMPQNAE